MRALFLLFIVMPILEMFILIQVGSVIGAWYTIGLVLFTAVVGFNLLKRQGMSTLMRAQQKAQAGALPVSEIGEGLLLAVAGALLLTPGFVTDTVGFALLSPSVRSSLAEVIAQRLVVSGAQAYTQNTDGDRTSNYSGQQAYTRDGHEIIDAEFEELKERDEIERKK